MCSLPGAAWSSRLNRAWADSVGGSPRQSYSYVPLGALPHECVIRLKADPARKPIAAAASREPVRCRRPNLRKPVNTSLRSRSSMYDAVASSRSAVPVARLSIASEPWRPVVRTEEAAAWSASPVSSRASSSLLPADRTNSSIDSLASLSSSDADSVAVFKVVKMFLQSLGWFACAGSNRKGRARLPPLRSTGGQIESPGDNVPKQRKLHDRRQCLHLAVCAFRHPVSPGPNRDVGRTRAQ
jgi:hypothetical protein